LLQCCDLFVQPYPDGLSTRRTTMMALLQHGRPVVTNVGSRTEPMWSDSDAVRLVPSADPSLLADAVTTLLDDRAALVRMSAQARMAYESRFDIQRTVAALVGAGAS
jgi:glycosyltransferase involved in cell wall biosynthesis